MTVFKRRTRMVNFRLSEEEYKELKNTCLANGARSVSDFARLAVYRMVDGGGLSQRLEWTVRDLTGKVEELDREVKRLSRLLGAGSPSSMAGKQGASDLR